MYVVLSYALFYVCIVVTSLLRFVQRMSYGTMVMYEHRQSLYHSKTYIPFVLISDDLLIELK